MKIFFALLLTMSAAFAQKSVTFGTNWRAQAEHGGFYQALADGTYKKYGLDVTIVQGGANVNNRLALTHKRLDFYLGGNLIQAFSALEQGLPTRVASAIFVKDPQAILTHEGVEFSQIKALPSIYIGKIGQVTFFPFLKAAHGFNDANVKPYAFNPQVFIDDKNSAMQAYATSEPYLIEKKAGFRPLVHLLAEHGFNTPSNLIEVHVETDSALTKAFVDASLEGWHSFLWGDNALGKALILKENAEMNFDFQDYAISQMKALGIVSRGTMGVLDKAQIAAFYADMVKAGVVKPSLNPLEIIK